MSLNTELLIHNLIDKLLLDDTREGGLATLFFVVLVALICETLQQTS